MKCTAVLAHGGQGILRPKESDKADNCACRYHNPVVGRFCEAVDQVYGMKDFANLVLLLVQDIGVSGNSVNPIADTALPQSQKLKFLL